MRKLLFNIFLCVIVFMPSIAQVTFNEDVASIIYTKCTSCHRVGESGPFPLTNYSEVKRHAKMVQFCKLKMGICRLGKPDPHYSNFLSEKFLTDTEIATIDQWVKDGKLEGNPNNKPKKPEFPDDSQFGEPDLTLSYSKSWVQKGDNKDTYRVFVIPTGLKEDKWIKAIEIRPSNLGIAHHTLIGVDTSGAARKRDKQFKGYGYPGFGGYGVPNIPTYMMHAPGSKTYPFPKGLGQKLPANSDILVIMHYGPSSTEQKDSTVINLFFADNEKIEREVKTGWIIPTKRTLQGMEFKMPPNEVTDIHCKVESPADVSLLAVGPHMHYLGVSTEVFAVPPKKDTTKIIRIKDWDFDWQTFYFFPRFVPIKKGTSINVFAKYDNTASNPLNPNNPPKMVKWGEGTLDEMLIIFYMYVPYKEGDEDRYYAEPTNGDRIDFLNKVSGSKKLERITIYNGKGKVVLLIQTPKKQEENIWREFKRCWEKLRV